MIIFAAAILAYNFFFKKEGPPAALVTTTGLPVGAVPTGERFGQEFLSTLLSLRNLQLDNSLFDNKEFKTLQDFTFPIPETGPRGRPNPFAPLTVTKKKITAPITTGEAGSLTSASAILTGLVDPSSTSLLQAEKRFSWGETQALENNTPTTTEITSLGEFSQEITGLDSETVYYFRAEVLLDGEPLPGETKTFITPTE